MILITISMYFLKLVYENPGIMPNSDYTISLCFVQISFCCLSTLCSGGTLGVMIAAF
jgi:hypothetical protein